MNHAVTYESVLGFSHHDDIKPDDKPLPAVPPRLGLRDTSDDRWPKFLKYVEDLNKESPPEVSYKFFLLARHGQGYHNVGESKYGTIAWDKYEFIDLPFISLPFTKDLSHWSRINGDDEITWGPDPILTILGKEQAAAIQKELMAEAALGLPPPHKRYCSPFSRALDTCDISFGGVYDTHPHPVLVVENCREENGVHTCDKRETRSFIQMQKPHFVIEESLTEEDELWDPDVRETKEEVAARARTVIDMVFENDIDHYYISITSHSGFITGFLKAVGRNRYPLPTGGILPVLVKRTRIFPH